MQCLSLSQRFSLKWLLVRPLVTGTRKATADTDAEAAHVCHVIRSGHGPITCTASHFLFRCAMRCDSKPALGQHPSQAGGRGAAQAGKEAGAPRSLPSHSFKDCLVSLCPGAWPEFVSTGTKNAASTRPSRPPAALPPAALPASPRSPASQACWHFFFRQT